jgi:hypothetical protein
VQRGLALDGTEPSLDQHGGCRVWRIKLHDCDGTCATNCKQPLPNVRELVFGVSWDDRWCRATACFQRGGTYNGGIPTSCEQAAPAGLPVLLLPRPLAALLLWILLRLLLRRLLL